MRIVLMAAAALACATPAAAQSVTVAESRYDKAPWWMDQPIIASTGYVESDVEANRARFSVSFQAVDKTAAAATQKAANQVRDLGRALAAYGADKVRVETTFNMRPLFDQYRTREGQLVDNQRADQVESYEVNANVSVEVRDMALLERVYATVLAARPTSTQPVYFNLEPDNATRTEMYRLAMADANRRARLAVEASGARLGAVKLIDPTGRACETDVLVAGAPRSYGDPGMYAKVEGLAVGNMASPPPPPAPPPPPRPTEQITVTGGRGGGGSPVDAMQLPLQAPLQKLQARACVVYALAG